MRLEDVADELYGVPPAEFVAVRGERVRQARDGGDKELAAAIGKLRRPTVAAWAVNLLAREAAEDVEALLSVGDTLREAQRRLSGEQLRALTTQRQQVVNALTRKAGELAAARGQRLSESVLRDVGGTLQAALADQAVAEEVRTGTLTAAASYEGFGPAALVAVAGGGTDGSGETDSGASEAADQRRDATAEARRTAGSARAGQAAPDAEAAVRRDLEETLAEVESARAERASAAAEHDRAAADLAELESRIAWLREELDQAEERRRFSVAAERAARDVLRRADRHLAGIERRAEKVRERLSSD
ncbi:hypothetical protein [Nocardia crassostreae]|uniref:hypothetical protein n=1 Tax=Nocardia crassostreae TaxID=53428 RepID=UPI000830B408|nr:hypothetical protein [Nocardia crassostreae]